MSDDHKTTSAPLSANGYPGSRPFSNVNNEHAEVDELILELVDYKKTYADMAAEKLLTKVFAVGKRVSTYRTAYTMCGFLTAPAATATDRKEDTGAIASAARVRRGVRAILMH